MRARYLLITLVLLSICLIILPVDAQMIVTKEEYIEAHKANIPVTYKLGMTLECGNFRIRLLSAPILTKSAVSGMVADGVYDYLIFRMGITNTGTEPVSWLTPDSFSLQENYLGFGFGVYPLDYVMSGKATRNGTGDRVFFESIKPGEELITNLIFEVNSDIDNWVFRFAPRQRSENQAVCRIEFIPPKEIRQNIQ